MATQMGVALGVALGVAVAVGHLVLGEHWAWVVLTAFVVCSGNRGRGDVVRKSLLRVAGGAVGTGVATILSGLFGPADPWQVVAIFVLRVRGRGDDVTAFRAWLARVCATASRPIRRGLRRL